MFVLEAKTERLVAALLAVLMAATRVHHFGVGSVAPDASTAVFLLAGLVVFIRKQNQYVNVKSHIHLLLNYTILVFLLSNIFDQSLHQLMVAGHHEIKIEQGDPE